MPESADHSAPAFPAQHAPTTNHPRGWFNYLRWPLFFLLVGGSAATGYYALRSDCLNCEDGNWPGQ